VVNLAAPDPFWHASSTTIC